MTKFELEERLWVKTNQGKNQRDLRELGCQYLLCHEPGEATAGSSHPAHGTGHGFFALFFC